MHHQIANPRTRGRGGAHLFKVPSLPRLQAPSGLEQGSDKAQTGPREGSSASKNGPPRRQPLAIQFQPWLLVLVSPGSAGMTSELLLAFPPNKWGEAGRPASIAHRLSSPIITRQRD